MNLLNSYSIAFENVENINRLQNAIINHFDVTTAVFVDVKRTQKLPKSLEYLEITFQLLSTNTLFNSTFAEYYLTFRLFELEDKFGTDMFVTYKHWNNEIYSLRITDNFLLELIDDVIYITF